MKVSKLLFVVITGLLSACADMSSLTRETDEIKARKGEMEAQFSSFKVSDSNYLDIQDNSLYPNSYWALNIKTTYFTPVSLNEVLADLANKMHVSYFDKGNNTDPKIKIMFEGSVDDYLKYLADAYDVFIDVDKSKIVKRNHKTKIYKLYNSRYLKNESNYAFGSQVVEGGGNGFSGSIAIGGTVDLWKEVEDYLDSMEKTSGAFNYSIFREFSQISTTGSKNELDRVALFVNKYNKLASTEVKISYKIVTISQDSMKAIGADIQGGDGSSFQIGASAAGGYGGQDVGSILLGYAVDGSTDKIGGSLTAQLVKSGAKIMNEGVAISLNGKPVPVNSIDEIGYVSTITREPGSDNVEAAETIETDTLETGMSFMIVPEVLTDGRVNITMGYSRKRLNQLVPFGDEGDSVQLPDVSRNENINNLIVEEGQETVAAIFTEEQTTRGDFTGLMGKSMSDSDSGSVTALIVKVDTKK
ncbi:hypothetical protein HQQ94_06560 [Shewanella sp. VB17]|uniref:hypothetical protein n=1 Tax=Shewanella sp. VB17 TaxID=2739432 RepID=UPI0015672424|nr:hypothetical protein [Shewanella sp. VB17]NRD72905.1 hypothetical protein [Shewanella sp. VB17]